MMWLPTTGIIITLIVTTLLVQSGEAIKCSVCETSSKNMACLTQPPPAQYCPGFQHCIALAKYQNDGKLETFTRSCSPFALQEACMPGVDKATGRPVQVCYSTCSKDGCNGSGALHHVLDLLRRK